MVVCKSKLEEVVFLFGPSRKYCKKQAGQQITVVWYSILSFYPFDGKRNPKTIKWQPQLAKHRSLMRCCVDKWKGIFHTQGYCAKSKYTHTN